ncbi:uncharacterized protein TRIADDRAFT_25022 [Trichoplax adhaerens]|uniref:Poly A polymerase head domain-containing protein n=1 Tax=Trichoplax adhaerens TaxID=10228 RepID=B3RYQ1_TRIAD|nr:hypothetical protein TRIADDRAFT_25022 [Trichoplax adhaerens]EDV24632.1 hypothetical protein TRIADDRAFT_25022 [Trichoplax adhaerens]|eukprot:XP_002112522.1 hypothetical protein TRIADDRAFT_25022 [Trichoplax adhaerens]
MSIQVDTPNFRAIITDELKRVIQLFQENNYQIRLVGGVVRDVLLDKVAKDIDLATDATPDQMIEILKKNEIKYVETGLQHGTITVIINKAIFEITTLRIDAITDGRHAQVQFTNDWRIDAERRDLTINAMSLSIDGTLFDYFNGREDLINRRIIFVGNTRKRIQEDYLRILRYFRFYGRIAANADSHDPDILQEIRHTAAGLEKIASERIWMEMSKILVGNFAPDLLRLMYDLGVASHINLPKDGNVEEFQAIWDRMRNYKPQPAVLLASLVNSVSSAEALARTWKLSNVERFLMKFITGKRQNHYTILKQYQDLLFDKETMSRDHIIQLMYYNGHSQLVDDINNWVIPKFPIGGNDLKSLGHKPGPQFKRTLDMLKKHWMDTNYKTTKEELLMLIQSNK